MLAFLASFRTVSQPDSTTGEKAMTSTFCWMYDRIALIWFSCFCWASENLRSMPAAVGDSCTDFVLAVRQPLSAPTWAKPIVIVESPPPLVAALVAPVSASPLPQAVASTPTATSAMIFFNKVKSLPCLC